MAFRDRPVARVLAVVDDDGLPDEIVDAVGDIEAMALETVPSGALESELAAGDVAGLICATDPETGIALDHLDHLRANFPDLPIIVLLTDVGAAREVLDAGATEYLHRDLLETDVDRVRRRLAGVLGRATEEGRSRDWFESLVTHSTDSIAVVEADGTITYQSGTIADTLGHDPADVVGQDTGEYIHPEDLDRVIDAFEPLVAADPGETATAQYRFRDADGEWVWVESVARRREPDRPGALVINSRVIEERKENQRLLERYRTLLDLIPDTVVVTDLEGTHQELYGFEGWSGYSREELLEMNVADTMPESDFERTVDVVGDLFEDDDLENVKYELDVQTKSGERVPFENHLALLPPDESDEVPGTMSVLRDISDRKARERRLEQAETVFQNVQDAAFLAEVPPDEPPRYLRINEAYEDLTGTTQVEVEGLPIRDVVDDRDLVEAIESEFRLALDEGRTVHEERRVEEPDGTRHLEVWIAPVDVEDEVPSVVGLLRDVTELRERQAELRLRTRAMDEAPIGIAVSRPASEGVELSYVNQGLQRMTGYDETDLVGRSLTTFTGEETDPSAVAEIESAIDEGDGVEAELLLYDATETPFWARVTLAPVETDGSVSHVVAFLQDVTERKEYETEIERRFDEFADVFAEELRAPLAEAREELAAARRGEEGAPLEGADRWLDRLELLLDDLAAVHSHTVPSRDHSETALRTFDED